ncbi:MAG: hydroxyacylglutathione hydrolase [Pseudomonadota bacterium]
MTFEILTIPCLSDNYAFVLVSTDATHAAIVDAPEAGPIVEAVTARGLQVSDILITHHHSDHVDAVDHLRSTHTRVIGAQADAHRLPVLDLAVVPGQTFDVLGETVTVIDAPGHTRGHVAYYLPDRGALFSGDSLMAMGCGRLFEGTPQQMWASLSTMASLPPATLVYSGHEYTAANIRFAQTIEPDNAALAARAERVAAARAAHVPTVPSRLSDELATNPFLRAGLPEVKARLDMEDGADEDVFAVIRSRKDKF